MDGKKLKSREKVRGGEQETKSSLTICDLFLRINAIQHLPVALRKEYVSITAMNVFGKVLVLVVIVKNGCINPVSHFMMVQILVYSC